MTGRREMLKSLAPAVFCPGLSRAQADSPDPFPDIRDVAPDLVTPAMTDEDPGPGRRVRGVLARHAGTGVHHALYLPPDWRPGRRYPVLVEYAGNGNYRNTYGDGSHGTVEGSNLGYGLSGGRGFLWLCLPYVDAAAGKNAVQWWGDAEATASYCREAVAAVCRDHGGDAERVVLCGFSRGAIACNYIGLRDDATARLWRGFFAYSHYDGVRRWPYADSTREDAAGRLMRLGGRPVFVIHERSVEASRQYLGEAAPGGNFTFVTLRFRNHNDAWVLRDIPERRVAREWLARTVGAI